ncbi:diguanylate cyclase [Rhodococcus opacus]|uniref:Diguanylate cyclase n=1 Tax=Rhodococcus opacus TaxID=37919 RepID=A0A2S8IJW4_RHOOP|nr:diguanylate cyclase [Rhodococcus opacus]PQP15068.1 diguanylate cyclase [Rhodococcus opacus]
MSEITAGVEVSETAAVAEATRLVQETTSLLYNHHSRRVFFFGQIHAHRLGVNLAAMFHATGLVTPFSDAEQRFEVATTHLGVPTDVVGFGLDGLHTDQVTEIRPVDPRRDLKNEFLGAYSDGFENRSETTNGSANSDVLEHFPPGFRRATTVERVIGSARACWPGQASGTPR